MQLEYSDSSMPFQDEGIRVTASEDEEETSSSEEEDDFEDDRHIGHSEIEVPRDIEDHSALTLDKEGEEEDIRTVQSRNYQKTLFWPLVGCFLLVLGAATALAVLYTLEVISNDSANKPSSLPAPTIPTNAPSPNPAQAPSRPPQEVNTVTQEDLYRTTMELFQMNQEMSSEELTSWQEATEMHLEFYYSSDQGSELESGPFILHDASSSIRQILGQNLVLVPGENGTTSSLQIVFEQEFSYQASTFFGAGENSTTADDNGVDETVLQGFLLGPFLLDAPQRAYIQRLQRNVSFTTYSTLTNVAVSSFKRSVPATAVGDTSNSGSNTTESNIFDPGGNSNSTASQEGTA